MASRQKRGRSERSSGEVREFLLQNIAKSGIDPTKAAVEKFGIQPVTAYYHLKKLQAEGRVAKTGATRAARWHVIAPHEREIARTNTTLVDEYNLWQEEAEKFFEDRVRTNVAGILRHGFTEMVNNVIDHSRFRNVRLNLALSDAMVKISVEDDGVGIFHKIQNAFKLSTLLESVNELHKGKLTTDSTKHAGEGIFFTSRMFDRFEIRANGLRYVKDNLDSDWYLGEVSGQTVGTAVTMQISPSSNRERTQVFQAYTSADDNDLAAFDTTEILVNLSDLGVSDLVSRSQAKRVLAGLDKFRKVILDFRGITTVGQGFADEVLRIFPQTYPQVNVEWRNANAAIDFMLRRNVPPSRR